MYELYSNIEIVEVANATEPVAILLDLTANTDGTIYSFYML